MTVDNTGQLVSISITTRPSLWYTSDTVNSYRMKQLQSGVERL